MAECTILGQGQSILSCAMSFLKRKAVRNGILQWLCVSMGRTICACHGQRPISVCRPSLLILCGCEFNKQSDPAVIGLLTSANSENKDEGHANRQEIIVMPYTL